jgi:Ca2+-transporting ATPase
MRAEEVLRHLDASPDGLEREEVLRRQSVYGANRLRAPERPHPARILLHQFAGALMYVLIGAMLISLAIGHWQDAIVIGIVLVLNAGIGFLQEYRAEHAISALMQLLTPRATVERSGQRAEVASEALVPGDIVCLASGDLVPADLRLIEGASLEIDEALLTGESLPVAKQIEPLPHDGLVPLAERSNIAFTGATVTSGRGRGVVVATGAHTELGAIAGQIRAVHRALTPLQKRLGDFGRWVSVAIVGFALLTLMLGVARGEGLAEMFLTAVAIAVSAVPEGLPVVMTIALAVSVRRMARRRAIVRRLPAVETLGSCSVIVTDKTGTLTRNQMTLQQAWAGGARWSISGSGLELEGAFLRDGVAQPVEPDSALHWTLLGGALCNEAEIVREAGSARGRGDPTEVALLVAAAKAGLDVERARRELPRLAELPFESWRQFAGSIHRRGDETLVLVKGAPERIVEMCDRAWVDGEIRELDREEALRAANRMADDGLRVLAVAVGHGAEAAQRVLEGRPDRLVLAGLVGMLDPPRAEVPEAIATCERAGIRVIMVTGDHARTAGVIARRIGLDARAGVLAGGRVAALSDEELGEALRHTNVFARVSPADKLRIVELLSAQGEIVAVTGDGVNDAPALKAAHVGAAMGLSGSDVAREASEIVLTDDCFASIGAAIEEGRTAFSNIRKATFFLVSSGVGELLSILASLGLQFPLPLLPAQILWLNVVTNGVEHVGLAFEPAEPDQAEAPPRPPREGILSRRLLERLLLAGGVMALGTLGIFWLEWDGDAARLAYARVAALTTLVAFQVVHVGNCRSENRSAFALNPFSNRFLLVGVVGSALLHVAALYFPPTQALLGLEPLTLETWSHIGLVSLSIIVAVELHKWLRPPRPAAA